MLSDHEYHCLRVRDVIVETNDSRSFVLDLPSEFRDAFAYRAGQFCTFRAEIGGELVARCYSMSSSPDVGDPLTVTVKRVPGGTMSNWMIDTIEPGDSIEVLRPTGLFVLDESSVPIVAFAGGSGITPVISIIKTALATTDRSILLVYANKDADSVIFADELERLRSGSGGRLEVHHHLDAERGFLDAAACAGLVGDRGDAQFYVCGPALFMDVVEAGLARLGVTDDRVFIERFVTPEGGIAVSAEVETETVVFRLGRRKRQGDYRQGDTLLEAARRAGLSPPSSCEGGGCATCMAMLADGTAVMRVNNALTPAEVEEGWILTCQAIPTSRTVTVDYDA